MRQGLRWDTHYSPRSVGGQRTEGGGEVGNRAIDGFGGQDPSEGGDVTGVESGSCTMFASVNLQLAPSVEASRK